MTEQVRAPEGDGPQAGTRALMPPPRPRVSAGWWILAVLLLAMAAGGWWSQRKPALPEAPPQPSPVTQAAAPAPAASAVAAAEPASGSASAPAIPEPTATAEPLDERGVPGALSALFGAPGVQWLVSDDFVRRFVVTVDNLGREQAPARLWPVQPTPGRFQVIERGGQLYADPDNALRYTPLVLLAEQVDPAAAVALYRRMLPLLQAAYEQLGYPGQRFHARLVSVIDHLLAAPRAPEPMALTLVEVKGEVPSERPWVRYEFADPALQSASAGQKILLRVGPVNQRRLKAQLRSLRAELVRQAPR